MGRSETAALRHALGSLTEAQRLAVESEATALCVHAGAGSGKTRVLTLRAARRIADGSAGADHTTICTFTRKAAGELRARLERFGVPVAGPGGPGRVPGPGARVGTVHQLALTLLRRHAVDHGRPLPVVAEHRSRLVGGLVGDAALAVAVDTEIGWAKARCLGPDGYAPAARRAGRGSSVPVDEVATWFGAYEAALARRRSLDLDDVLVRAADLVGDDPAFAEAVRWRYRHLSVDEFQDVNPAQFRLVSALMGERGDLFAVGDPNQAIYGWNGADPELIDRLPSLVPGMEVVRLDTNHRSTPQIVAAASAALGATGRGAPSSAAPDGPLPVVTAYDDDRSEVAGVVADVLRAGAGGRPWSEMAVLARTNDQLALVAGALRRAGVPVHQATGPDGDDRAGLGTVELATFHRAKGLEWASVHVIGIEDGYVPIVHVTTDAGRDEERRLLYVALTRAGRELRCSWARRRQTAGGRWVDRQPSPWLAAVARVACRGSTVTAPVDVRQRIAELRAGLRTPGS